MRLHTHILTKQNADDLDRRVNTIPSVFQKNAVLSRTGMPGMCVHLFRTPECNYDLRGGERRNGNRGQMKGTDLLLPSLKTTEMMKRPWLFSLRDLKDTEALSFSSTAPISKQHIKSLLLKPNQISTDIMRSIRKQSILHPRAIIIVDDFPNH